MPDPATIDTPLPAPTLDAAPTPEELWLSEQRYRSLTVATSQIIWITNAGGEVERDIPSWRAYTGQSPREVRGLGWSDAVHPDDRRRVREVWQKAVNNRSLYDIEYRLRRHDGQYRMFAVRGVPVLAPDGSVLEWVGACTDITERKRIEAELEQYRNNLEELVTRRTEQLARSNEELERFAYVASHDLQEPLRVVVGYVQLLQRRYGGRLDGEAGQFFAYIVEGVARMQQLITDLLDYSRLGIHGGPFGKVNLRAVVEAALANLKTTIDECAATIEVGEMPEVHGDESQLIRLFQNLIGNALKFRGEKPPHVRISAAREGEHWRFAVADNGIGIERQYWERIFVIFQRLHTRQKYPGTGIGLALCKRIVERHGGVIRVESRPGEGSIFYFTLR
jgi:PAS domain S-box-containing protein